jgi:hypothetical protein
MTRLIAAIAAALLLCLNFASAQDHPPLKHVVVHNVTVEQLQGRCPQTYACSIGDFSRSRCDVLIPVNTPRGWPSRSAMLRHELRHCNGKGQD